MMRMFLLALIFPFLGNSQKHPTDFSVKRTIFGKVVYTSQYIGGAFKGSDIKLKEYPYSDLTLYVVKLHTVTHLPKVVRKVKTKKDGEFKVILPAGKYGFVVRRDIGRLKKGQFLPGYKEWYEGKGKGGIKIRWEWYSNWSSAIDVSEKSVSGLKIINNRISVCNRCP
ncbi:MAG: hypothetical protein WDZ35_14430 [Crocinitomicaceae bacterium]